MDCDVLLINQQKLPIRRREMIRPHYNIIDIYGFC